MRSLTLHFGVGVTNGQSFGSVLQRIWVNFVLLGDFGEKKGQGDELDPHPLGPPVERVDTGADTRMFTFPLKS